MARDGSGNYNLPAGNPVVTGTVISSTQFNATMTDIATAMTQSISKDGQTTPTGNLPMGGNKHTGVADGNLGSQYASVNQTQNGSLNKATAVANVVDAFTASLTPAIASYTDGQVVYLVPSVTNTTTTVTLALNGLAAKPVLKEGGVACAIGDIALNIPIYLVYYSAGGYFLLLNPLRITGSRLTAPLTLNGVVGGTTLNILSANANSSQQTDASIARTASTANTVALGASLQFLDSGANTATQWQHSGGQSELWQFNSGTWNQVIKVSTSRGVTINAPTGAAVALALTAASATAEAITMSANGATGAAFQHFIGGGSQNSYIGVSGSGQTLITGAAAGTLVIRSDTAIGLSANSGSTVQVGIATAGNVTFAAPTSGTAVTIAAVAGARTAVLNSPNTASQSFGPAIAAGTNSSDSAFDIGNAANTLNWFRVRGDGVVFGNDGTNLFELGYKGTPLNVQSSNYTLVLADRGKTVQAGATIAITVPNSVFSAGDVVSILVGSGATVTITQGSGVSLQWAGNGSTTGSRTLTGAGLATLVFASASVALISGAGLT